MGLAALKLEPETSMEDRVARLESDVAHIRTDVGEMRQDIRRLDAKIDVVSHSLAELRGEMRESNASLRGETKESIAVLRGEMKSGRLADRIYWLLSMAAMLGVMAKGFKWI